MWCIFSMPNWVKGLLILCHGRIYNIITHTRIWVGVWLLALCLWFRSPRNAVWKHPSPVWLQLKLCSGWRLCALWSCGTRNWVVQAVLSPCLSRACVSDLSWVCGREGLGELASWSELMGHRSSLWGLWYGCAWVCAEGSQLLLTGAACAAYSALSGRDTVFSVL